jgi:hypothetical protein
MKTLETANKAEAGLERKAALSSRTTVSPLGVAEPDFQSAAGNLAVQRLLQTGLIQAKLTISQPDDPYEQEADRVAEQVMRMPASAIKPKPG